MQKFTSQDLLLYLFDEMETEKRGQIENALPDQPEMRNELSRFRQTLNEIDGLAISPDPRIMENILTLLHQKEDVHSV